MTHPAAHTVVSVIALAVTLGIANFTVNRLVKRKLRVSAYFLITYIGFHLVLLVRPQLWAEQAAHVRSIEQLVLTAALINLAIVALLNPLRADRVPDRFPSILQDAIVIGILMLVATFIFGEQFLTTGAVSAVVVGFALQDTLGNAFAGLAIQSEKPFHLGQWISVGDHQGRVAEVTWRATKLRTRTGNFVIVPNSEMSKAPITNFSDPAPPTRLFIDVGVSYDAAPNVVKRVIKEALVNCPLVLKAPAPDAMIRDFGESAVIYRVRFWITDYEFDEEAEDQVRSSIYYAFRRNQIDITYPIAYEISKEMPAQDDVVSLAERERLLAGVEIFAGLNDEQRAMVAAGMRGLDFGDGEAIVRQGEPGSTMYVIASGRVAIMLEETRTTLATLERGAYFGEMSLLTGDPRTASAIANGDVRVLEVDAEVFRQLGDISPQTVEQVGVAAATRRAELVAARASARSAAVVEPPANFLKRMRKFLQL